MDSVPLDDEGLEFPRLDRSAFVVYGSFEEAEADERRFWLAQPPVARLRQLRYLHWMNHGHEATTQGLARVLEIAERG